MTLKELLNSAQDALDSGDKAKAIEFCDQYIEGRRLRGEKEPEDMPGGLGDSIWNKLRDKLGIL